MLTKGAYYLSVMANPLANVTRHARSTELRSASGQTVPALVTGHKQLFHFSRTEVLHLQTTRLVRSVLTFESAPSFH